MYVFGRSRRLERSTQQDLLKDATYVFEGDYTDPNDKKRIVDTVLALWSLIIARKESSFEVQLIYSRINTERHRTFPKEFVGDLADLIEKQMGQESQLHEPTRRARTDPGVYRVDRTPHEGTHAS